MARQAGSGITGVEADEFGTHRIIRHRRHDAEVDRLQYLPEREGGKRVLHCWDQLIPMQQTSYAFLIQMKHGRRQPLRSRLSANAQRSQSFLASGQ